MPRRFKVVVTDFINDSFEIEKGVLGDLADILGLEATTEEELVGKIEDADALIVYHVITITEKTIARLESCKVISRGGVGFDNVDGSSARARGIDVCNVPDYGTEEVADTALGMTLALVRGIAFYNSRLRDERDEWDYRQAVPLWRLRGRVFGIVGLGRIGTAAALRAKALGMKVLYHDPYKPLGYDKSLGVTRVNALSDLLPQSHIVSLHCPLTEETRHLINATTLGEMRDGAYLINTARGGVVDVSILPEALRCGKLAGAGIDVLETEPPNPDDPLIRAWRDPNHPAHDRLILTPHAAFYCEEGLAEIRRKGAENCRRALLGEPVVNVVN